MSTTRTRSLSRRPAGLLTAVIATVVLTLGLPEIAFAQVAPSTLTGEAFNATNVQVQFDCDPMGTSTISFYASGIATGPYPGTFVEQGVYTIGPQVESFRGARASAGSRLFRVLQY